MDNEESLIERYRLSAEELLEADNQIIPELAGTGDATNPFKTTTSSSRNHMNDKFLSQKLHIEGAEPRRFYTGIEKQMGDYGVNATMPSDGTILRIIPFYKRKLGKDDIVENPRTLIIYEEFENEEGIPGVIRSVMVENYHTEHKTFGFKFKPNHFSKGDFLPKGFPLNSLPSISPEGQYCYGLEAKTAFISVPGVTEDGVIISRSFSERLKTTITGTAVISYGEKYFPLNVHGNEDEYKPFLDIGDKIDSSGLLCVLREYNPLYDHVTLSKNSITRDDVDYNTDRPFFGLPNAEIIDINVIKRPYEEFSKVPEEMIEQTDKYFNQKLEYYREIISFNEQLAKSKRRAGEPFHKGYEYSHLVERALEYVGSNVKKMGGNLIPKKNIKYTHNKVPLDSVRIEIKYALKVNPVEAFKITNGSGGKAVVVSVWDDDRMPVDDAGNRAEVIMDDVSILKRINVGVFYEQFMGAILLQLRKDITKLMETDDIDTAWSRLDLLYKIMSPLMHRRVSETITTMARKREHVQSIIDDGIYIYLPTHSPNMGNKMLTELKNNFKVPYGPITYKSVDGKVIRTKSNVLIGTNYMMLLNKIGDGWSAVTGAKLQHHGLPAKLNSSDRNLAPGRKNPVKFPAEAEIRSIVGVAGAEVAAEIADRSNDPNTNKQVCRTILEADNPSDIEDAALRHLNPYGGNRSLALARHLIDCMGASLTYGDEK